MRTLSPELAASLAGGATTLARCWRLTRADGLVLGFTDHDGDIVFDGIVHAAGAGLEAAESEAQLGFAIGGGEVAGALSSASLREEDLAAGRWDAASVEVWLVDWTNPDARLRIQSGTIGEVRRAGNAFTAEVRGPAAALDEERGRVFQAACAADLGDARCRVDLSGQAWRAEATVSATEGSASVTAGALSGREPGLFTGGRLAFLSGANAGVAVEVRRHAAGEGGAVLELWHPMSAPIAAGDRFVVTAGCDKRLETCRERFGNVVNFRGFPHMPGNDFVLRSVRDGEGGMDGGSLFR